MRACSQRPAIISAIMRAPAVSMAPPMNRIHPRASYSGRATCLRSMLFSSQRDGAANPRGRLDAARGTRWARRRSRLRGGIRCFQREPGGSLGANWRTEADRKKDRRGAATGKAREPSTDCTSSPSQATRSRGSGGLASMACGPTTPPATVRRWIGRRRAIKRGGRRRSHLPRPFPGTRARRSANAGRRCPGERWPSSAQRGTSPTASPSRPSPRYPARMGVSTTSPGRTAAIASRIAPTCWRTQGQALASRTTTPTRLSARFCW